MAVRPMARRWLQALITSLLVLPTVLPQNLIRDGDFVTGGPAITRGRGWEKVDISDCVCAATGALMVRPSEEEAVGGGPQDPTGSAAELSFRVSQPAGVFVFEAFGTVSLDYVGGSATIYSLTAYDGDGDLVAHAEQEHIFFNASQRFAAWHLYSLQLVCPAAVSSVVLRIGSGVPAEGARGSLNSTELSLTYEGGDALPVLSRGLAVDGPMGQYSRGPSLVTDGVTLRPPLNLNHWKVVAFTDRLKQLELDLGEEKTVCGARLVQTLDTYAARWSIFGASGPYGPWSKIIEAVPAAELAAAGAERSCTGAWAGEEGCVLGLAEDETSVLLWPCRRARYIRLDLEEPNDCCYQILEWETLGIGSWAFCSRPCQNGGKCAVAYAGAVPQCDCPVNFGWRGPMSGCTDPICGGGCQNDGKCAWRDVCDCAPGYSDQSCTTEYCGDGAQSKSEICDDGNFKGNDGCVKCELENNDPKLVWPSNTSLAAQWYILYPPPPPDGGAEIVMSYVDTGDGGGVIVGAITLIGLTHIFACCYIGSADTTPVSADAKREVERLARM